MKKDNNKQYTAVNQWYSDSLKDQALMRVVFGVDSGDNVSYIGYSQTPGGI